MSEKILKDFVSNLGGKIFIQPVFYPDIPESAGFPGSLRNLLYRIFALLQKVIPSPGSTGGGGGDKFTGSG